MQDSKTKNINLIKFVATLNLTGNFDLEDVSWKIEIECFLVL